MMVAWDSVAGLIDHIILRLQATVIIYFDQFPGFPHTVNSKK